MPRHHIMQIYQQTPWIADMNFITVVLKRLLVTLPYKTVSICVPSNQLQCLGGGGERSDTKRNARRYTGVKRLYAILALGMHFSSVYSTSSTIETGPIWLVLRGALEPTVGNVCSVIGFMLMKSYLLQSRCIVVNSFWSAKDGYK